MARGRTVVDLLSCTELDVVEQTLNLCSLLCSLFSDC